MASQYVSTYKDETRTKILNPITKRYVAVGKRKHLELIRDGVLADYRLPQIAPPIEHGAIPIVRGGVGADRVAKELKTKYNPNEVSSRQLNQSKKFSIVRHETKEQLPLIEFAKMIHDAMKGLDTRGTNLIVETPDSKLARRTLSFTKPVSDDDPTLRTMTVREIYRELVEFAEGDTDLVVDDGGSDNQAFIAGGNLMTNAFDIKYVPSQRGGSGAAYKARTTQFYNVIDYQCSPNDCLFAIIMKHGNPEKLAINGKAIRVSTMRKQTNIFGSVDVNDVIKVGDAFDVGITVYTDEIATNTVEELVDGRTKYSVEVIRNPLAKPNESHERQIEILYEDRPDGGHFSYIKTFRKPTYDSITGEVFRLEQSMKSKKDIVMRKGGVWKDFKPDNGKTRYKHHILVYDFETVFDEYTGTIKTYSVGWIEFDENEKCHDFRNRTSDVHIAYGEYDTCQRHLLEYIMKTPEDVKLQLVTYNGSRFDSFILASVAADFEDISHMTYVKGSILDMTIGGRHNTLDLCRLTTGSLDANCKAYKTLPTKVEGFSHVDIQNRYIDGTLMGWLDDNRDIANEYLVGDVLSTASLYVLMRRSMKEITEITIGKSSKTITASGMAWKYFLDKTDPELLPKPAPTQEIDAFFRKAINGGRTQAFNGKFKAEKQELRMVDVCSLYPSVMVGANRPLFDDNLNYSMWPIGEPIETDRYVRGKVGIYRVTVRRQPDVCILPRRVEDEPLDWNYRGEIETNTSSTSIELIRKFGGIIDVHNGYYWENSTPDLFKESINPLFVEKQKQDELKQNGSPDYNPCRREVTKLLMNSMSGKFAQRNFEDKADFVPSKKNPIVHEKVNFRGGRAENWIPIGNNALLMIGKKHKSDVYSAKNSKPSYIAVFIYEFARTYMYITMLRHAKTIYMDTDSALINKATYDMVLQNIPHLFPQELEPTESRLKTFGDYEEELYGYATKEENRNNKALASCITIAPKCYLVYGHNDDGTTKIFKKKVKGVRLARDILLSNEDKALMESSDLISRHYYYNANDSPRLSKPENVIKLFETLYAGGEVHVLSNQWTREIGDHTTTPFVLRQRYIIKTLNREESDSDSDDE